MKEKCYICCDLKSFYASVECVERGLDLPGVKILMKAGSKMGRVKELLLERDMEVSMVENCGMDTERCFRSAAEIPEDAGYFSLLIAREKGENR